MKHGFKVFNWLLVFAALVSAFPVSAETTDEFVVHDENTGLLEESNPGDAFSFDPDDYELILNDSEPDSEDRLENCSSAQDIIASIKSDDVFTMDGTVITDAGECNITEYYDFSKLNKYEIADWAWGNSLITEEEKIDCYCDLILQRNFDNITCLTSVFFEVQSFRDENTVSAGLDAKIEEVFALPFENADTSVSVMSISNEATYESTNFTIHYDSSKANERADAIDVANYFEQVRQYFINLGYNTPILQLFKSKYQVYLDPGDAPNPPTAAATIPSSSLSNTCASHIIIYYFDTLDDFTKVNIAHEYFHAIQFAYNKQVDWFCEACATWASLLMDNTTDLYDGSVRNFVQGINSDSLPDGERYGAVLFPMTLQKLYGKTVIRKIYEEYYAHSSNIDLAELRTVITTGIRNNGNSNGSFDIAYRRMAIDICDTANAYSSIFPAATDWSTLVDDGTIDGTINITQNSMYQETTVYGSVKSLTAKYYKLSLPSSSYNGSVRFSITFGGSNCYAQLYYKRTDGGSDYFTLGSTGETSSITLNNVGSGISEVMLILCNLNNSGTLAFNVKTYLRPKYQIDNTTRYIEYAGQLNKGQVAECLITFAEGGSKVFQTCGTMDTYLFLLTPSGGFVASSDNEGYGTNAFMRYEVTANTEYLLRVHNASGAAGSTKVVITPTTWLINSGSTSIESFADIWTVTGRTSYTLSTSIALGSVKVFTFTAPSAGYYTFQTTGSKDTYMYVIDPRSSAILTQYDYDDDDGDGNNALITKALEAGVPYLVFYSAYNIQNSVSVGSIQLTVTKDS